MSKFSTANETSLQEIEKFLSSTAYLSGSQFPGAEDSSVFFQFKNKLPSREKYPNTYFWYTLLMNFQPAALKAFSQSGACAEKKKEDDFDLFGDDDGKEVEEKKPEVIKPKPKKKVIAKSIVIFNVKVYEQEQDLNKLAQKILTEIVLDGLTWKKETLIKPIAFGMNMLEMGCIIEDEKVSTDDIFERIEAWEDEVQSTDVVSFQKL